MNIRNRTALVFSLILANQLYSGCAVNPKYTEPSERLREQAEKSPQNSDQIKTYQKDFENYQNYKRITEAVGNSYQVISIKDSSWYAGDEDSLVGIGNLKYHYLHKINLSFVCGPLKFDSKKFANKKIKWQITDQVKGEELTNKAGKILLIVKSETDKKFDHIVLSTSKRNYTASLGSSNVVELDESECN
jgi:hypothetical protein